VARAPRAALPARSVRFRYRINTEIPWVDDGDAEPPFAFSGAITLRNLPGRPLPTNGIWIAASAMEHGLRLLALDRRFLATPQILVELE
jgi:predicted nucleic acid-binding protein